MIETHFDISTLEETSIEVDPRTVTVSRIETLHKLGFNRLSFGIQDFDDTVQEAIGRKQSYEGVQLLFDAAQSIGFLSINCDLIYGLPLQNSNRFETTIKTKLHGLHNFKHRPLPWIRCIFNWIHD